MIRSEGTLLIMILSEWSLTRQERAFSWFIATFAEARYQQELSPTCSTTSDDTRVPTTLPSSRHRGSSDIWTYDDQGDHNAFI
jgi:hypothetical protein